RSHSRATSTKTKPKVVQKSLAPHRPHPLKKQLGGLCHASTLGTQVRFSKEETFLKMAKVDTRHQ
ncbi:hypothetical protein, partial [Roseibacillus ishigakijimensis]|uniref:hypothetical protein n=1 Tax=Roseibacillus ishigakijimensis TaxID=454146 RepID=UPI0036425575